MQKQELDLTLFATEFSEKTWRLTGICTGALRERYGDFFKPLNGRTKAPGSLKKRGAYMSFPGKYGSPVVIFAELHQSPLLGCAGVEDLVRQVGKQGGADALDRDGQHQ